MYSILLVEDDPGLRDAAYEALETAGYHVVEALSSGRAEEVLQRIRPALVLVDLEAAGAAGLPGWIAAQPSLSSIPVVAMTSYETDTLPPHVHAVLLEPFDLEELLAVVAALVDEGR